MTRDEAKKKIEELMGRLDALKAEVKTAHYEYEKFASQGLIVEAREAEQDKQRLEQRKAMVERELEKYKKFW
jgi:hypothetical protein